MAINVPAPDFSNAKNMEEKFQILADSYNMLRKELDYILQNLSYDNFDSISAKNIKGVTIRGGKIVGTEIGGGKIVGAEIEGGQLNINDAYIVDAEGNVQMLGSILLGGNIIWTEPVVQYQYSSDNQNWHTNYIEGDIYRRESWDGGITWQPGYQFIGINGVDGQDGRDGSDATVPNYIKSTYIGQTKILSPDIIGGMFYATGQGRNGGAAYYIYNGVSGTGDSTIPVNMKGYISYDDNGAGTEEEDKQRVFFKSQPGVALKIEAGGNMSIEAKGGTIHIMSDVRFYGDVDGVVAKFA